MALGGTSDGLALERRFNGLFVGACALASYFGTFLLAHWTMALVAGHWVGGDLDDDPYVLLAF